MTKKRVHTRRTHRRVRGFDWEIEGFAEAAASVPFGANPQELLRAMADEDELWELIGLAARLKKDREEVLDQIKKIRDKVSMPFKKQAKRKARKA